MRSVLVANRGEIACRVMRTAREMGMRTIAVYSDADADALHVREADAARRIGPAPAAESYLLPEAIVAAARATGAEAIHPGYGFLSESTALAAACAAASIVFVGPPVPAIEAMGRKDAAQALMAGAGIPVLPGYRDAAQDDGALAAGAEATGYPVIVKPSAGGGGKGMRVVHEPAALGGALESARREATSAFGDAHLVIERYLERPRHVEVQVFCDTHGGAMHLLERDCSVQRRHQKVVEEAPAPGLPLGLRERMGAAAVEAARTIGYVGAGTVEFLLQATPGEPLAADAPFYFMEMNTRLQVEHPVTEMILGLDLVEWQLRIAAGERLPRSQATIAPAGHAVEVRVYAEDPGNAFLPSTGRVEALDLPEARPWLRVDSGVAAGDAVSVHYDPMLAKVIALGESRAQAIERLLAALARCDVVGPTTNLSYLERIVAHPAFRAGEVDTSFVDRHADALLDAGERASRAVPLAAIAAALAEDAERAREGASPWLRLADWRLNEPRSREVEVELDGERRRTRLDRVGDETFVVRSGEERWQARMRLGRGDRQPGNRKPGERARGDLLTGELDGERVSLRVRSVGGALRLHGAGLRVTARVRDPDRRERAAEAESGHLASPMPGKVVKVLAAPGDEVAAGQALVVVEAMKMEHTVAAPRAGRVRSVACREGEQVDEGVELVTLEE